MISKEAHLLALVLIVGVAREALMIDDLAFRIFKIDCVQLALKTNNPEIVRAVRQHLDFE